MTPCFGPLCVRVLHSNADYTCRVEVERAPTVMAVDAIVTVKNEVAVISLVNAGNCPLNLPRGLTVGHLLPLEEQSFIDVSDEINAICTTPDFHQLPGTDFSFADSSNYAPADLHKYYKHHTATKSKNFDVYNLTKFPKCPPPSSADIEFVKKNARLDHLPESEKPSYLDFLIANHCCFSKFDIDLGKCKVAKHHIALKNPKEGCYVKQFPLKAEARSELKKVALQWLGQDCIMPSNSDLFNSPLFCVPKFDAKTGRKTKMRPVQDFRSLNAATKSSFYKLPTVHDSLKQLSNASLFSTVDLSSGYWQVELPYCRH